MELLGLVIIVPWFLSGYFASTVARHKNLCTNCYFWAGMFFGPCALFAALVMPTQPTANKYRV